MESLTLQVDGYITGRANIPGGLITGIIFSVYRLMGLYPGGGGGAYKSGLLMWYVTNLCCHFVRTGLRLWLVPLACSSHPPPPPPPHQEKDIKSMLEERAKHKHDFSETQSDRT